MGTHKSSDSKARKEKYAKQFDRTKKNKEKHISLMKKLNSLWPGKKPKAEKKGKK